MKRYLPLSAVLLALAFISCRPPATPVLRVETAPALEERARQLLRDYPLPEGLTPLFPGESLPEGERAAEAGRLELVFETGPAERGAQESAAADVRTQRILLERSYRAPRVPIYDMRRSVSREEALRMRPVALAAISPPYKAIAVGGRYPGEAGYPLVTRSYARLIPAGSTGSRGSPAPEEARDRLVSWFAELKEPHGAPEPPRPVRIGGVGDMMLGRGLGKLLIGRGEAGRKRVYGEVLPLLERQDLLLGNLEGAVTRRGRPTPKSYNFRFPPEILPELAAAGFDYLSLTNNHCWDYGLLGFTDTLEHLAAHGIPTSGAGLTPEQARRPALFSVGGQVAEAGQGEADGQAGQDEPDGQTGRRVKVLSVAAYPQERNGFDGRSQAAVTDERPGILFSGPEALAAVREFSGDESIDVVMVHGGEEWHDRPSAGQRRFYRALEKAGADLVLGSHPHVLQGLEGRGDGLIAYSLGNFLFPGMYVIPRAEESLLLSVLFYGDRPLYVEAYPVQIDHRTIDLERSGGILRRLAGLTLELNPSASSGE